MKRLISAQSLFLTLTAVLLVPGTACNPPSTLQSSSETIDESVVNSTLVAYLALEAQKDSMQRRFDKLKSHYEPCEDVNINHAVASDYGPYFRALCGSLLFDMDNLLRELMEVSMQVMDSLAVVLADSLGYDLTGSVRLYVEAQAARQAASAANPDPVCAIFEEQLGPNYRDFVTGCD